ncbi:MAG TPA: DUF4410 domain-containing protein [Albitalea sp.]|uniref:DUF4410 domain-containing protein n=1 Tax=Piscinibacter sp. TaxID=1903157 RepID=UPI002ED4B13C
MEMKNKAASWRCLMASMLLALAGCAGTVKQDARFNGDVSSIEGLGKVVARMSPAAIKQQADNPQFSRDELATYLYRKLESKGLIAGAATHHVDIVVTDIRVRSAAAAVMLGLLAGEDRVTGTVRVMDPSGKPLRSFEIKASYALGGWGGGQDSMRMNWMYDKFSELALTELEKIVAMPGSGSRSQTTVLAPGASATPAVVLAPRTNSSVTTLAPTPAAAPAPVSAPVVVPDVASLPTTGNLEDVEAVPVGEKGREAYRQWLTWKTPRVFVVADGQRWNYARGTTPADPMQPRDPVERALKFCQDKGHTGCTLYAVDFRVVYPKPASTAQR